MKIIYVDPPLTHIFKALTWLSLISGVILCFAFWPGEARDGYEWKTVAYTSSIVWLTAGVIQAAIFAAIGQALSYLHAVAIHSQPKD